MKYTFDYIKTFLIEKYGYHYVSGEYNGLKSLLTCIDDNGYLYLCNIGKMIQKGTKSKIVHPTNPYSIQNINNFLKINTCGDYICVSNSYSKNNEYLEFKHLSCGRIIKNKWINIGRGRYAKNCKQNKTGLFCPYCDAKQLESTHALILKQVWLHEHPDTIVEEKSCVNPNTGHVMPTDIVNHNMKIAIEIQSWFHDFEDQKKKDEIKKLFWLNNGYNFFAIDQRDYTVIDMIQLFFPEIKDIPNYIDYSYSNKFDDVTAQKLLNKYKSVNIVAEHMSCNPHLIYDAIAHNRITYPSDYTHNRCKQVVQLSIDGEFLNMFDTITLAEKSNGISGISQALRKGRNYC